MPCVGPIRHQPFEPIAEWWLMVKLLLEKAAALRDQAARALRLAIGLQAPDQARLTRFSEELRDKATELERQAAETPARAPEQSPDTQVDHEPKKKRGSSNDPDPKS